MKNILLREIPAKLNLGSGWAHILVTVLLIYSLFFNNIITVSLSQYFTYYWHYLLYLPPALCYKNHLLNLTMKWNTSTTSPHSPAYTKETLYLCSLVGVKLDSGVGSDIRGLTGLSVHLTVDFSSFYFAFNRLKR